jgi:hypothetical protein
MRRLIGDLTAIPHSVTAQKGTKIIGDNGGRFPVVSKELRYGKAETLEDAGEAARWWRYNIV